MVIFYLNGAVFSLKFTGLDVISGEGHQKIGDGIIAIGGNDFDIIFIFVI